MGRGGRKIEAGFNHVTRTRKVETNCEENIDGIAARQHLKGIKERKKNEDWNMDIILRKEKKKKTVDKANENPKLFHKSIRSKLSKNMLG